MSTGRCNICITTLRWRFSINSQILLIIEEQAKISGLLQVSICTDQTNNHFICIFCLYETRDVSMTTDAACKPWPYPQK
jgi:hypothetical protein